MQYETILYNCEDGICRITLNRPQAMNAITPAMLKELNAALQAAENDNGARIIVISGAGKAFCAGVDLKALGDRKLVNGKVGDILDLPARELINTIRSISKVVIASIHGFCIAGALEIMLACDLVIASDSAKIGDTHAKWGLRPTWGMSARLPGRIGFIKARELSFTAGLIPAGECARIGLINYAVPAVDLEKELNNLIGRILANSPASIAAYKKLYNTNEDALLGKNLQTEFSSDFTITDTEQRLNGFNK